MDHFRWVCLLLVSHGQPFKRAIIRNFRPAKWCSGYHNGDIRMANTSEAWQCIPHFISKPSRSSGSTAVVLHPQASHAEDPDGVRHACSYGP